VKVALLAGVAAVGVARRDTRPPGLPGRPLRFVLVSSFSVHGVAALPRGATVDEHASLADPPVYDQGNFLEDEDFTRTVHAMGTSLVGWVQETRARGRFADDARVVALTSEGNRVAWRGYAAVSAAKAALEAAARSIAVELAPRGLRCNIVQAGVTRTAALALIPGSNHLAAGALRRNPLGRLTTPEDVANAICLLATDEAAWINGALLAVDGGERNGG